MSTRIRYEDLEQALFWVSSPPEFEAEAFLSRNTGKVYFRGTDGPVDDDFPDDIEGDDEYVAIPHKNELNLGRDLVFRFINEHAAYLEPRVHEFFRHKGAYSRLKALFASSDLMDIWHEYERLAIRRALEAWASENGLTVEQTRGDA